tara:strand:- start:516 stop:680 length:165 start_codon:yes stop_codon:yes gene_type:complete
MDRLVEVLKVLAITAFFCNIFLLIFGATIDNYELQILALVNMILLSFGLLRDEN